MDGVTTTPLQDILPPPSSTGFQSALLLISSKSDDPTMRNPTIIIPPSMLPAWISQISCEDLGYNYRTLFHPTMKEPQQSTLTLHYQPSLLIKQTSTKVIITQILDIWSLSSRCPPDHQGPSQITGSWLTHSCRAIWYSSNWNGPSLLANAISDLNFGQL